ncbi:MAG: hydroxymethylglutaryl-CoA lyase [Bacteroidetes bacterium]|nr:hydroxymethylglutaryl-CoA lyase [Bacteroidota bacterium]
MRVKIIECPRDAMQGLDRFVPTELKVEYLNALLKVGYHTIDCGSFVSPAAIPQMRDTSEVLAKLDKSSTRLSVIVANQKGIDLACKEERVNYLGYPFSVSEIFQQRNTHRSIADSFDVVKYLLEKSTKAGKEVVIYISMGFGNPYGEEWNAEIVTEWVGKLRELGADSFSISDTVGVSHATEITDVFTSLLKHYSDVEFGAHFHTTPENWKEKVQSAWESGCRRFDGAIAGFGGCPMAEDELVGNMPTENLVEFFAEINVNTGLDPEQFTLAKLIATRVFS